jgi:cytochrome c oxidase cbb3-type subunit 3
MNKLVIFGIILVLVLTAGTYAVVGDMIGGDIVNLLALGGAASIAIISVFVVLKYIKQMQNDTATGDLAEENWDGIGEYKNELPIGWALSIVGLIIWGMWYMMAGYPLQAYSQLGEYNEDVAKANEKAAKKFETMTDTQKLKMGEGLFSVQCAPCHGPTGNGQENYATGQLTAEDLTKRTFSKEYVEKVIREGSNQLGYAGGMMPMSAMGITDDADIVAIAEYVAGGMSGEQPAMFATCAGCHGAEGEGMDFVAPSLKSYNADFVKTLLSAGMKKGEIGVMPKFAEMLTAPQVEALAAYVAHGTDTGIEE